MLPPDHSRHRSLRMQAGPLGLTLKSGCTAPTHRRVKSAEQRQWRPRSPALHAQEDLFTIQASCLAVDSTFATVKRLALDEHSWVDVVTGWVSGSHILFERLKQAVSWQQHDREIFHQTFWEPRLTGRAQIDWLHCVP